MSMIMAAVADITAHLRKTIISLRNTNAIEKSCRIRTVSSLSSHFDSAASASASERSGSSGGDLPARNGSILVLTRSPIQVPSRTQRRCLHSVLSSQHLHHPPSNVHISRGLASKAHMRYNKRKKAPVDLFQGLDPSQPRLGFEKVKELETANDTVKKIFSLEFGTGTDLHKMRRKLTQDSVRDKPDEKDDLAVKIATITEHIRALAPHVENNKKDSVNKVRMLNAIDRRRKMLKYLRKRNYARFERLLLELNLTWTPPPDYYVKKTRRSMEKKAVVKEGYMKKQQALKEFEERWRQEKLLEIAKLKEDLGKELTEEESNLLLKSREETAL
ncbi:small ribosomal subunit protein uS15m-like [Lytechinus pictus]|uniref:small ribosomal subunit protein uS15m-like n=1 Tax=Lytechinus pictus TaxID=7653 RepID=UPI0030B9B3F5